MLDALKLKTPGFIKTIYFQDSNESLRLDF